MNNNSPTFEETITSLCANRAILYSKSPSFPSNQSAFRDPNGSFLKFLGGKLGIGVVNWYCYDGYRLREQQETNRPLYQKVYAKSSDSFLFYPAEGESRPDHQPDLYATRAKLLREIEKNEGRTIAGRYKWFLNKDYIIRSEREKEQDWILIELPEILLFSYEYKLRQWFASKNFLKAEALKYINTKDGSCIVTMLWDETLVSCHEVSEDSQANLKAIWSWIKKLRIESANPAFAANSWLRSVEENSRISNWFLNDEIFEDCFSSPLTLSESIMTHSEYNFDKGIDCNLLPFVRQSRFSPPMELLLHSRNVLLMPLWYPNNRDELSTEFHNHSTFIVFIICNLFDSKIAYENPIILRSLFLNAALSDIVDFSSEQREYVMRVGRAATAAITHELRQPLSAINMSASSIKDLCKYINFQDCKEDILTRAERILTGVVKANDKIDEALRVAGLKQLCIENVSAVKIVREAIKRVCPDPNSGDVRIRLRGDDSIIIEADPDVLPISIASLIKNSVWAVHEKFGSQAKTDGEICVEVSTSKTFIKISVFDNGIGIPKKEISNVWNPEYSRKTKSKKAHGVGLPLARQLILSHNGRIEIDSRLGKWTHAIVSIPLLHCISN